MKLTLRLSFLSDYHIGTGYGDGRIDSTLLRDNDGFPTIRGTTLSGLLRQSMWELLQLEPLKHHRRCKQSGVTCNSPYCSGDDMCPICRIMGTPAHGKRWHISSARMETRNMRHEKIISRNKVDLKTRTTEKEKLFSEEIGNKNTSFIFTINSQSNSRQIVEEAAFIVAACRMIRSLGSSRTRGKGKCTVHLVDASDNHTEEGLLDIFKTRWLENRELDIPDGIVQQEPAEYQQNGRRAFTVILLTEEPLLIANRGKSGNRYNTNTHIPGFTFLGALAWSVARRHENLNNEEIYERFIGFFKRGKLRISPLYPALKIENDVYPSIPSPLDLLSCELYPAYEEDGHYTEGFATCEAEPTNCKICAEKGVKSSVGPLNKFLALREPPKHLENVEIPLREEIHITIDPMMKNVVKGEFFSYMVIESGQYFIGTMEIEDWSDFANLLNIDNENLLFYLRIGKAFSRGYGKARIKLLPNENSENLFTGQKLAERVTDLTAPIRMTLITDAIIIDRWGRFLNTIDEKTLRTLLNSNVKVINTYAKSKIVDGFNAYLGLPKWRDIAICAGSTIGFRIGEPCDSDNLLKRLEEVEKTGIGIRKEEGFGRVVFNHPVYNKNRGVYNSRMHLDQDIRTEKRSNEIEMFDKYWEEEVLNKVLSEVDFSSPRWMTVARWFRTTASLNLDEFHTPKDHLKGMIDEKQPQRDKKKFLREKQIKEYNALREVLRKLEERLENEKANMREYLKMRAMETLAEFIALRIRKGYDD
jgi:CRISPR-associated protein Csx10